MHPTRGEEAAANESGARAGYIHSPQKSWSSRFCLGTIDLFIWVIRGKYLPVS